MSQEMTGWTWRGGALVREVAPERRPGGAARPLVIGGLIAGILVAAGVFLFVLSATAAAPQRDWGALVAGFLPAWLVLCVGVLCFLAAIITLIASRVRNRREQWLLSQPDPVISLERDGIRAVALNDRGTREQANVFVPWASIAEVAAGPGEQLGLRLFPGGSVFDAGSGEALPVPVDRLRTGGAELDAAVIAQLLADPHRRRTLLTPDALDRVREAAELAGVPVADNRGR